MTLFRRPLSLLRWFVTSGPRRLRAARLRRAGSPSKALTLFVGPSFLIELIFMFPDPAKRTLVTEHICRKFSAGCPNADRLGM